ncbi:DUF6397 family protein [Streptomyces sp. Tu6071]|uniref:DUF6397 family protein n=1 Tax=Streptomyces sp. Tu6071 TaxID=355249 RepID=UPI00031721A6
MAVRGMTTAATVGGRPVRGDLLNPEQASSLLELTNEEVERAAVLDVLPSVPGRGTLPRRFTAGEIARQRAMPGFPHALREAVRCVGTADAADLLGIAPHRFTRLAKLGLLAPVDFRLNRYRAVVWAYLVTEVEELGRRRPELLVGRLPAELRSMAEGDRRAPRWRERRRGHLHRLSSDPWERAALLAVQLGPEETARAADPDECGYLRRLLPAQGAQALTSLTIAQGADELRSLRAQFLDELRLARADRPAPRAGRKAGAGAARGPGTEAAGGAARAALPRRSASRTGHSASRPPLSPSVASPAPAAQTVALPAPASFPMPLPTFPVSATAQPGRPDPSVAGRPSASSSSRVPMGPETDVPSPAARGGAPFASAASETASAAPSRVDSLSAGPSLPLPPPLPSRAAGSSSSAPLAPRPEVASGQPEPVGPPTAVRGTASPSGRPPSPVPAAPESGGPLPAAPPAPSSPDEPALIGAAGPSCQAPRVASPCGSLRPPVGLETGDLSAAGPTSAMPAPWAVEAGGSCATAPTPAVEAGDPFPAAPAPAGSAPSAAGASPSFAASVPTVSAPPHAEAGSPCLSAPVAAVSAPSPAEAVAASPGASLPDHPSAPTPRHCCVYACAPASAFGPPSCCPSLRTSLPVEEGADLVVRRARRRFVPWPRRDSGMPDRECRRTGAGQGRCR